jgi:hypothetical protein
VVIDGATGEPATGVDVRAYPQVWNPSLVSPSMSVGASGAFDISGLAPGSYFLGVGAPPNTRNTTQTAAIMALEVGERDVDNLRLVMTSGVSIRGHLSFEGGVAIDLANSTLRAGLTVSTPSLITWDSSFPIGSGAAIRDSGFTISGIQPGTYRFSLNPILSFQPSPPYDPPREIPDALRNTYVKSVRLGAQMAEPLKAWQRIDASKLSLMVSLCLCRRNCHCAADPIYQGLPLPTPKAGSGFRESHRASTSSFASIISTMASG